MKNTLLVVLSFLLVGTLKAQFGTIAFSDISQFLSRMETKGIVPLSGYNRYLTQTEMRQLLNGIDTTRLSSVELKRLKYLLKKELTFENESSYLSNNVINGLKNFYDGEKLEFFESRDSVFTMKVRPLLLIGSTSVYSETQKLQTWGLSSWGQIGSNIEYRMDFTENSFTGKHYDKDLNYSSTPGRIYSVIDNGKYEFSETNGSMLYTNSYITLGLTKEKMKLGSGIRGQLVLSEKAPSFPAFYLKLSPANWINIYSMHGWLISQIKDSSRSYSTVLKNRELEYDKYYVMHALQIFPTSDISFTFGETIIYSDRSIYAGYFVPFLFYRSVDHQFTFGSEESGNNGSLFFDLSTRPHKNLTANASLFIDEFALKNFLKGDYNRNQLGYTFNVKTYPMQDGNLEVNFEYTKVLPWVYSNWIPTQTYRNAGYVLGHYIGQNSDQFYMEFVYTPMYNLQVKLWGEHIRRGGFINVKNQYEQPGESFLYGSNMKETNIGCNFSYEILYNAFLLGNYQYSKVSDEDLTRTPAWSLGGNQAFSFSLSYGF